MSYSVRQGDAGNYEIYEKDSSTVIEVPHADPETVRSLCRKLNLGSGFAGWTPPFFAKAVDVTYVDV